MNKKFIEAWHENKDKMQRYLLLNGKGECITYEEIVKIIIDEIINPYLDSAFNIRDYFNQEQYDSNSITVVDDGDYQGTLIFIIPRNSYQPEVEDYIYTSICYGSCGCCDALQDALLQDEETRIKDIMTIALHLIEGMDYLVKSSPKEQIFKIVCDEYCGDFSACQKDGEKCDYYYRLMEIL